MRRAIIEIDPEVLVGMLRGHPATEVWSDVPSDMTIIGCGWDETRHRVRLAVQSVEFADVPDGTFAPDFTPTFTTFAPTESARFAAALELLGRTAS